MSKENFQSFTILGMMLAMGLKKYILSISAIFLLFLVFFNFYNFVFVIQAQLSLFYPHHAPSCSTHSYISPSNLPLLALFSVLYTHFLTAPPLFSPIILLPTPLWLLSVCFLFQCLWLDFACLFCWLGQLVEFLFSFFKLVYWIILFIKLWIY